MANQQMPVPEDMKAEVMDAADSVPPMDPRDTEPKAHEPIPDAVADCPHLLLSKHWDAVADMGKEDKVSGYRCNSCGTTFSAEEGEAIQRLQHSVAI